MKNSSKDQRSKGVMIMHKVDNNQKGMSLNTKMGSHKTNQWTSDPPLSCADRPLKPLNELDILWKEVSLWLEYTSFSKIEQET